MPRPLHYLFCTLLAALLIGAPIGYARYREAQTRNFRVVRDGVLYRSGQMTLSGFKQIVREYGIKTVVTLRGSSSPGESPPDLAEEQYCLAQEINHYRLPPAEWWAPEGQPVPADANVRKFRAIVADPANHPVLVHCFAGTHRTGAYCAIYRMEFEGWNNEQALGELKTAGYSNLDDEWDLLGYLEEYRPGRKEPDPSVPPARSRPPSKPGKRKPPE
jgi:tyrosine-protein phosphatase SIW14